MPESCPLFLVVLYDGVCGLCNQSVQFVLRHDRDDRFRFAALQSEFAQDLFRTKKLPDKPETVYLLVRTHDDQEQLLAKSDAGIRILCELGGPWRMAAGTLKLVPRPIRDWAYDWIAQRRYQWFGRYAACPLPSEENRGKFLDQ